MKHQLAIIFFRNMFSLCTPHKSVGWEMTEIDTVPCRGQRRERPNVWQPQMGTPLLQLVLQLWQTNMDAPAIATYLAITEKRGCPP